MNEKVLEHMHTLYVNFDFEQLGIKWEETAEYKKAAEIRDKFEEDFKKTLTEEQQGKYYEFYDLIGEAFVASEIRVFCDAFKLAQMLALGNIKTANMEVVA